MCFFGCRNKITIVSLTAASFILTCCLVLVMANEFPSLPKKLIKFSSSFSLRRRDRSIFVIFIITTLAVATGLNIVSLHFFLSPQSSFLAVSGLHFPSLGLISLSQCKSDGSLFARSIVPAGPLFNFIMSSSPLSLPLPHKQTNASECSQICTHGLS